MDSRTLPGEDLQPKESHCPSCGIYVGIASKCPRCGAEVGKHISVRVFRWAAVLLAIGGLLMLYLMATHRELPLMKVEQLQPTMYFAYIRIAGTVSEEPRIFRKDGTVRSLRFSVDDGTGEINVTAYRTQAQELIEANLLPHYGQNVVVAGSLAVTGGEDLLLRIQTPEHVTIEGGKGGASAIEKLEEIDADRKGEFCTAEGLVTGVYAPKPDTRQPWNMKIEDDTERMFIIFWEETHADLERMGLLETGRYVRVTAEIDSFRGMPQLRPRDAYDIIRIDGLSLDIEGNPIAAEPEDTP